MLYSRISLFLWYLKIQFFSFQSQVRSTKFIDFICAQVLPVFPRLDENIQTQVLKLLAELCMFKGNLQNPLEATQHIYKLLMVRTRVVKFFWSNPSTTPKDAQSYTDQRLSKPFLHLLRKKFLITIVQFMIAHLLVWWRGSTKKIGSP